MDDIILKNFTVLTKDELELVLKWRNSERVRMMMVNKEEIPLAEHLAYAARLRDLPDRRYYLVCIGDRPCAVIDYTEMEPGVPTCNTGLYAGDGAPFGFGMLLEHIRYHGVFVRFGYPKTHSPMRKENERYRQNLLNRFGLTIIGENEEYYDLQQTREAWEPLWKAQRKRLFERFGVSRIVWRELDGEIVTFDLEKEG